MKILYSGPLAAGQTSRARMEALRDIGHEVFALDTESFFNRLPRILHAVEWRTLAGPATFRYNRALAETAARTSPDVVWIDKGVFVRPPTLRLIRRQTGALLVHYNTDDVMHSRHPFRLLRRSTSEYDLHLTTNVHNLDDLPRLGARRVALSALRYDSRIFYPRQFTDDALAAFRSEVTFIGHWEERTEQTILDVIAAGVPIKVWGDNWSRARGKRALRNHVMGYSIWGDDYVRALHATKIALCLLSKWNRNTTACRSFEIPATGTFLLAERTDDHVQSYREGVEAEFFADSAELIEKIKHYLAHDRERASIAERGRQRCVASGYSYEAQAGRDWSHVQMLLDGSRVERSA